MRRTVPFAVALVLAAGSTIVSPPTAGAAGGERDAGFGNGGTVMIDSNAVDVGGPVRIAPDGRIVVTGATGGRLLVARRLSDGRVDPSFGIGGLVLDDFGDADPVDAAVQPDGRIVVLVKLADRTWGFVGRLVRYLPDGSRDPSFGTGGVGGFVRYPGLRSSLALVADGRILVSGGWPGSAGTGVARFLPSGAPDPSFGAGGFVEAGPVADGGGLAMQSDGTIVLAISRPAHKVMVVRISAGGTLLTVAGEYADIGGPPVVSVLPDDRFYVTGVMGQLDPIGRAQEDMVTVARFTSAGYLDSNSFFGTAGLVRFDLGVGEEVTGAVVDGSFLTVVGRAYPPGGAPGQASTEVVRMAASGQLDRRYGSEGVATIASSVAMGAARDAVGRLVVAATVEGNGTTDIAVIRLQAGSPTDAPPPTTTSTTAPPRTVFVPAPVPTPSSRRSGYWMVSGAGATYAFGDARHLGNAPTSTAVDLEPTPSANGYWIVDAPGHVFAFGDARHLGALDGAGLAGGESVTSISSTPSGAGYWLFT
ncbi:MAG: hypothetical protein ACR2KK_02085, partial [Acidimicrobiales bacterium]